MFVSNLYPPNVIGGCISNTVNVAVVGATISGGGAPGQINRANSGYIAFVAAPNFSSGTVDLLEIMNWAIAKGWVSNQSTLDQICFGVEIVSTEDEDAKFEVTAFSIDTKLKERKL